MVCCPCFLVPLFLFLWCRFLQPVVARFFPSFKVGGPKPGETKDETAATKCPVAACCKGDDGDAKNTEANSLKDAKQD